MTDFPPPPPSGYQPPPSSTHYGVTNAPQLQYAGIGARFGAVLIDGIIVALFLIPAFVALFAGPKEVRGCTVDSTGTIVLGGQADNALCEVPTGSTVAIALLLAAAGYIAGVVYYARGEGRGQTIGKRATGVRVVDEATGMPIGTGRGVGRFFARILSGIFLLGYIWALFDKRKQSWHDKLVSSVVVKA